MEKIGKNNYEAYVLDYLEGNLGAEETHDLMVFLEQHPDLKKDLDLDLTQVSLNPSMTVFEHKAALKVSEEMPLSMNTVDTWMLESVEGNLSASKQQELDDFVRKHQLEKTYTAYQSTILKADLNEVFENKRTLKVATGIVIPMYLRVAAIAAVAVLLIGVALNAGDATTETADTASKTGNNNGMLASKTGAINSLDKTINSKDSLNNPMDLTATQNQVIQQIIKRDKTPQHAPDLFVNDNSKKDLKDTTKAIFNNTPDPNIANQNENQKQNEDGMKTQVVDENNAVAIQNDPKTNHGVIVTQEPYKIVTDAASTVTKREVYFKRELDTETNEYVAYGFKIGGFEFERKK